MLSNFIVKKKRNGQKASNCTVKKYGKSEKTYILYRRGVQYVRSWALICTYQMKCRFTFVIQFNKIAVQAMITVPYAYHTQAIQRWLRTIGVNIPISAIDFTLENHPEWPSLLCVSDALNSWKIPNAAAKDAEKKPEQLSTPFLAVTQHPERPFAIVTQVRDKEVTLYQDNYKEATIKSKESFLQQWTGVYMLAEPNAQSGLQPAQDAYKNGQWHKIITGITAIALLCLMGYHFMPHIWNAVSFTTGLGVAILFVLYIAGLGISSLLLWHEIDKGNPILQKVCTGIAKTNCNAILNSKASKLLPWLSWSEVGFIYFAGGALLLAMPAYAPWSIAFLAIISVPAVAYPVFSIYYQWRVVKQWCALCLAIQIVLLLQIATSLLFLFPPDFTFIHFAFLLPLLIAFGLPGLLWYTLKPLLQRLYTAKQERRAYHRLKFNPDVFEALLKKQKAIQTSVEGMGIHLGDIQAQNTLVKVCNPYCGPCSKAHPKMEKILRTHPEKVNGKIIFMVPNEQENKLYKTAIHLTALASYAPSIIEEALDTWYHDEKKEYEMFADKYPLNGEIEKEKANMDNMITWCKENTISYTPTIFFNGHELPSAYDLEDVQYFLQK